MMYLYGAIALIVVALAGVAGVEHFRAEAAATAAEAAIADRDKAVAAAANNARALQDERAAMTRRLNRLSEEQQRADARARSTSTRLEAISRAPTSDDGPVRPTLRRVVDGMQSPGANADRGAARPAAPGTPIAAPVPPAPRSANR